MIKKKYISPEIEIHNINIQYKLLFGSDVDAVQATGLFEEGEIYDGGNDVTFDDNPKSIWDEAW